MTELPTCLDIDPECNNEPCQFEHNHKCTFHCRQWKHIKTGYATQAERDIGVAYEDDYGHTIPICQFCQKKLDDPSRLCPWLMYTKLGNSIVACAHFKLREGKGGE